MYKECLLLILKARKCDPFSGLSMFRNQFLVEFQGLFFESTKLVYHIEESDCICAFLNLLGEVKMEARSKCFDNSGMF